MEKGTTQNRCFLGILRTSFYGSVSRQSVYYIGNNAAFHMDWPERELFMYSFSLWTGTFRERNKLALFPDCPSNLSLLIQYSLISFAYARFLLSLNRASLALLEHYKNSFMASSPYNLLAIIFGSAALFVSSKRKQPLLSLRSDRRFCRLQRYFL